MEFGNLLVRPFQLLFIAVVLGLSIALVRGQYAGGSPPQTNFAVACGVVGAITMLTGLVAVFVTKLQGLVMLALDGLSTLFLLAGSIALAAKLGVHSCDGSRPKGWTNTLEGVKLPNPYCTYNSVINGGAIAFASKDHYNSQFEVLEPNSWFVSRCREAQALDAFLFLSLAAFAASLVFDLLGSRKNKNQAV